jgi:hypothetical protein
MSIVKKLTLGGMLLAFTTAMSGCLVETPREGYYDHPHHRYYHEHAWHECVEHDPFCR